MAHNPLKKLARYGNPMNWTNRYIFEKFATQMTSFTIGLYDAAPDDAPDPKEMFPKLLEHAQTTSLCSQMVFGGEAMAPAISSQPRFGGGGTSSTDAGSVGDGVVGGGGPSASDVKSSSAAAEAAAAAKPTYNLLLVRQLLYPEFVSPKRGDLSDHPMMWFPRRAHVGDVVAFTHPNPVAGKTALPGGLLVRRVVALEGDVMESGDGDGDGDGDGESGTGGDGEGDAGISGGGDGGGSFVIPKGHAWVVADNEDLPFGDVPDSRTFGPLHLSHVVGRVVYALRSSTDHGVVHNSAAAAGVDQPVLHAELDVELMAEELADFNSGTRTFRRVGTDEDEW